MHLQSFNRIIKGHLAILRFALFCAMLSILPAVAQAQDCFYAPEILPSEVRQVHEAVDKYEKPPFAVACQQPGALKDRPATGLLHPFLPAKDKSGNRSLDFFDRLQKKIEQRVIENDNMGNALVKCLEAPPETANCADARKWTQSDLPEFLKEARFHLSLAQSPNEMKTWIGSAGTTLNSKLSPLGSYKEVAWQPLNSEEAAKSQSVLSSYLTDIKQKASSEGKDAKFVEQAVLVARYRHYEKYHEMMSQIPIAQYLTSGNPSNEELLGAAKAFIANVKKERALSSRMYAEIVRARSHGGLPGDLLTLLNYSSIVEETLLESPEYCGLATSLVYTGTNRQIGAALAVGLPVLAASFFAPPLIGVAAGLAAGGLAAYQSQADLSETKQRAFSQMYGDPSDGELDSVQSAYMNRNAAFVSLPIGYGAVGAVASRVSVTVRAAKAGLSASSKIAVTSSTITSRMRGSLLSVARSNP